MADAVQVYNASAEVEKALQALSKKRVLVGFPSTGAARKTGPITNAALAYIHDKGSPTQHIPARPFLEPGIQSVQLQINAGLKRAAEAALKGDQTAMNAQLNAVGLQAVNAVRRKITAGPFAPLAESTVAARLRKTKAGRTMLRKLRGAGADLAKWGTANLRPLIDTGQLRQAVTYVIRDTGLDKSR